MRFLIVVILLLLTIFHFMKDPEPVPVEETFIGEQIKPLRKAEGFEEEYLKATDDRKKRMEEDLEKATGGG